MLHEKLRKGDYIRHIEGRNILYVDYADNPFFVELYKKVSNAYELIIVKEAPVPEYRYFNVYSSSAGTYSLGFGKLTRADADKAIVPTDTTRTGCARININAFDE